MLGDLNHVLPPFKAGDNEDMDSGASTSKMEMLSMSILILEPDTKMPLLIDKHERAVPAEDRYLTVAVVRIEVDHKQLATASQNATREKKTLAPTNQWISKTTRDHIAAARQGNDCLACGLSFGSNKAGLKRISIHVRQHWTQYFCPCGLG